MTTGGNRDTILIVCTGNICRSPLTEKLLEHELHVQGKGILCHSAGTHALTDGLPPSEISAQADLWGISTREHTPKQVTETLVREATLVLTAERQHRAELVALVPSASRKVFSLKQFARITAALQASANSQPDFSLTFESLSALVEEVADFRALTPPPIRPEDDDVPDPYRREQAAYDFAAEQIRDAITTISCFMNEGLR